MRIFLFLLIILSAFLIYNNCNDIFGKKEIKPLRADLKVIQRKLDTNTVFRQNEMIVTYKNTPTQEQINTIKAALEEQGIDTSTIIVRRCTSCGSSIELWQATGLHTVINTEGVKGGSGGGGSNGVGEDSIARYSVNFISQLPVDTLPGIRQLLGNYDSRPIPVSVAGKDTIVIAVLDTGVDTMQFVSGKDIWKNTGETTTNGDEDSNCYTNDVVGWNFVDDNPNIRDDNANIHGSIISQYIINQFKTSSLNTIQIMALKTHDDRGYGDLFSTLCALYYAMDKGAKIINASWGFYNYGESPVPYLDSVITQVLPLKGILFLAAAGNKTEADDQVAREIYSDANGGDTIPEEQLRNLEVHNFYPACLSTEQNNVITSTTTNGIVVSPTQNYSDKFVSLGIKADSVTTTSMKFKLPFLSGSPIYVSGSSFATAIASGKLGSNLKTTDYVSGIKKTDVFTALPSGLSILSAQLDNAHLVHKGRYAIP